MAARGQGRLHLCNPLFTISAWTSAGEWKRGEGAPRVRGNPQGWGLKAEATVGWTSELGTGPRVQLGSKPALCRSAWRWGCRSQPHPSQPREAADFMLALPM